MPNQRRTVVVDSNDPSRRHSPNMREARLGGCICIDALEVGIMQCRVRGFVQRRLVPCVLPKSALVEVYRTMPKPSTSKAD